ncbi:hypothetical protein Sste5346_008867 [Sporothrix stenoceras]|uniref:Carboxylesterase type B domain-containing protein n=1 Tax=Sporothrix stenoceras TaxID=5173 RepID=A0ABR3YQ22_9PEZI
MAAIEVDDIIYREWAIDRLKSYEKVGGDHYVHATKFVELMCATEDKAMTRVDWEPIMAGIPRRWAAPRSVPSPWEGVQDLTAFGPACPQVKEPLFDVPGLPVFGPQPSKSLSILADTEDEFRCLTLNLFAPATLSEDGTKLERPSKLLPVMVWVHGGAFRSGAGGVDLYDGTPLVSRSLDIGRPVVVVTLNYRLGVLGFIHSKQLLDDAAAQTDLPEHFRSTGNLALLDISVAFSWIKNNIAHFGGDPSNIMGFGESAGSGK